jgi:uncharacterized protein (DUF1499 family)
VICSRKSFEEIPMANVAFILSLVAAAMTLLGVLGAYLGLVAPFVGFRIFAAGALIGGLLSVIASLIGIVLSRGGRDPVARQRSLLGLVIGLGLVIVVLGAAATGGHAPAINDITTDLQDPPAFAPALVVEEYKGRDMSYPSQFVAIVREAYPDLKPLHVPTAPEATYDRALATAKSLGWEIVASNPASRQFDAREKSRIFHFVDDITVRVRPEGDGSRVDVRSKSRDGRGDFGTNAARIRRFMQAFH